MNRAIRKLLTRTGESDYGPRDKNPIYSAVTPDGTKWTIARHHWSAPTPGWGWHAKSETGKNKFGDNLEEVLHKMGFSYEALDPSEE